MAIKVSSPYSYNQNQLQCEFKSLIQIGWHLTNISSRVDSSFRLPDLDPLLSSLQLLVIT